MVLPVVIMICREVTMSALREWAASAGGGAHKVRYGFGMPGSYDLMCFLLHLAIILIDRLSRSTLLESGKQLCKWCPCPCFSWPVSRDWQVTGSIH